MALASAVFLLGACAEETVLTPQQAKDASPEANAIAFGTYMGKTVQTRAGATGSYTTDYLKGFKGDTWTESQAKLQGFGVFAYYTGTKTYGQQQGTTYVNEPSPQTNIAANFMFNQLVWWNNNAASDLITKWSYSPTKYWPNEINGTAIYHWESVSDPGLASGYAEGATDPTTTTPGTINGYYKNNTGGGTWFQLTSITYDVDDQNNNTSNDPATTPLENGGNVSFFAYAPYVDFGLSNPTGINYTDGSPGGQGKASGIVAINGIDTSNDDASAVTGDPILTYKLPASADVKAVDLLWGTRGLNGTGVSGAANNGVTGDGNKANDKTGGTESAPTYGTYVESILDKYSTNANLTKQTTGGTIQFAFKHALAKIGGSYTGDGEGDDEDGSTKTHGLMVILDIDDFKGAESGGSLEEYLGISSLVSGSKPEWNKYNTKVTIDELVIDCSKELADGKNKSDLDNLAFDYTSATWTKNLVNEGKFNLATGQWYDKKVGTTTYQQTTLPHAANVNSTEDANDVRKDAVLSEELAEPATAPTGTGKQKFEGYPIGVTTIAKNVYESESNPLVFIPGSRPIIQFTITYTVRTYDPNLSTKYTEVKQKITKRLYITDPVELNKQYNILMHLGLTSVKFDAFVADWDVTDVTGTTTNPTDGTSPVQTITEDVDHVYLPINVGEPQSVAATKALVGTVAAEVKNASDEVTGYKLGSKPSASTETAFLTISGMKATFAEGGKKDVELAHVTVQALNDKDQPVDWITWSYAASPEAITVNVKQNETVDDRTAKLRIIYDNVADEYDITQYGRKVQAGFTVNVYTDAERTASAGASLASGVTKYYTSLTAKYKDLGNDGNEVAGDANDFGANITEGYTLTPGDYTTVLGTTFSTKQHATTAEVLNTRTETSNLLTFNYDGVSVTKAITQDAPTVSEILVTIGGATSQIYSASTTTTGAIKVVAKYKDSNNKNAGEATITNANLVNTPTADKYSFSIDQTGTWASMTTGNGTLTMSANTEPAAADRKATLKVKYGTGTAPEGSATITQKKP